MNILQRHSCLNIYFDTHVVLTLNRNRFTTAKNKFLLFNIFVPSICNGHTICYSYTKP